MKGNDFKFTGGRNKFTDRFKKDCLRKIHCLLVRIVLKYTLYENIYVENWEREFHEYSRKIIWYPQPA